MRRLGSVCLFVFVSGSHLLQSAPLASMACLRDADIKLSDWSLSAFKVSTFVKQRGISAVWLLSIFFLLKKLCSSHNVVFRNTLNKNSDIK